MTKEEKFVLDNYEITTDGKIFSHFTNKWLKFSTDKDGYFNVSLVCNNNSSRKRFRVHRLVAFKYLDEINGHNVINHKNLNKQDNRVINLEWSTTSKNTQHGYDNSSYTYIKSVKVTDVNGNILIFPSCSHVSRFYNYKCPSEIANIISGIRGKNPRTRGKCKGFLFEFTNESVTTIERNVSTVVDV